MTSKKTWIQKMQHGRQAEVKILEKDFADMPAGSTMLIATPEILADYIRHIPPGKTTTLAQIRKDLAASFHANYTCPVTTGIFLRIVAEASYEQWQLGTPKEKIVPFWRAIPPGSPTLKKLSFPREFLTEQLQAEQ